MQRTAAGFGHETAFVLAPAAGGDVRLRYFVPRHEMEMCVHATVAAVVLLGRAGRLPARSALVETPLGLRRVEWDGAEGRAVVEQFAPAFQPPVADVAAVLRALGAPRGALARDVGPVQAVSTARHKLLVPLVSEESLDALDPDAEALWTLCEQLGVTGLYPFTLQVRGADAAARQFPLRAGYDEDPATGVAACALGAYLARHADPPLAKGWHAWTIAQGRAMRRPSLITAQARVDGSEITATRVGGTMITTGPR
jgi:PhzF family phenazine biosynthesis protein